MNINIYLGKIMLVISLLVLTSCADGNGGDKVSLNADDLWDQMAAERAKPLPVNEQADNSDANESPAPYVGLGREQTVADQLNVLQNSKKKYDTISRALEASIRDLVKEGKGGAAWESLWRTVQLHLSRLSNLKNEIHQAMTGYAGRFKSGEEIPPQDRVLFDDNMRLMAIISDHISRTRNSLNIVTHNE